MRNRTAVVMFCGPLLESGNVETRRISTAIKCALDERVPLVIVGDPERRTELELYESMAHEHAVMSVATVFAKDSLTESYASALAQHLQQHHLPKLTEVYLVTDHWHMNCGELMLYACLQEAGLPIVVNRMEVKSAIEASRSVRDAAHAELAIFAKKKLGVDLVRAHA
ncbi:hypothetical protein A3C09_02935 [Candidatus Uhrbacteria bacterium RIFCSPHIGHO2_02_FULL_47_44]|uniref:DUF218 domain-containing protein n=1 Tax=Candidatus Uhrbacteria bacterium RIFCSPLOWO2_02_FULL_48_18 TaxID=1802408 RepID=A0A1F7V987_9BACT|nr:MAG: hypothetical protein A2839_00215 [Candidatus Uhrbacteria bacterium RIFCSPHIGHO2_01_FULL_47_10]OGL71431.1 MAG: hypothetical protein A3C09_02935 [Candidatus Uhrbacteria bacterium RIFCSPHIGHO2_02_FULL_47_44]OGL76156.1 MAG: hypothetical protein A3E97_02895 [Candidatus Uhrbacteria bacterium RIFCSPHIGHO2_12_FULL_47_12]OGL81923.1 MAG: hypothetical protein A3B20_02455 [Candidatus Uhrbacteria bacterium RIFCSPLOWO2_01_FULL_47_17]OGL87086.1 MAG: hypothetical protein A3I41_04045 [Candidatus Uhrbact